MGKTMGHQDKRDALLEVVFHSSFQRGRFDLSSGKKSDFYLDGKQTTLTGKGLLLIAEVLLEEAMNSEVDSIGGLAVGADPIIGSVLALSAIKGYPLRGFMVRKRRKPHGSQKIVEGPIRKGDRVIIIDDVITTGGSSYKAIKAVEDLGCEVVKIISLVDRNEGGRQRFERMGYDYRPLITIEDIFRLEKAVHQKHKTAGPLSSHTESRLATGSLSNVALIV
jgi:orotate phosphoribosyltransferase